jgi:2-dehydro-3-deoxy-D-gluconate 5-dehydrogenase
VDLLFHNWYVRERTTDNQFDFNGKDAVATGANTGIGQGMSLGLAEAGSDIVLEEYVPSTEIEE